MSQYTISIKSIIDIATRQAAYADTEKRVTLGRDVLFSGFDYDGDAKFKQLFETAFILHYMNENICFEDLTLWLLRLKSDIVLKSPIYFYRYQQINNLMTEDITKIGGGTIETEYSDTNENERKSADERQAHGFSHVNNDTVTRVLGSQFPQDIKDYFKFEDVKHMDSGSMSDSESDTHSFSDSRDTGESTTTDKGGKSGTSKITKTDNGNKLEQLQKYFTMQKNIINEFVNSFSDIFMQIW